MMPLSSSVLSRADKVFGLIPDNETSRAKEQAKLWINHDKPSSDARRHAPEFYE
jgi:hypothetical protein